MNDDTAAALLVLRDAVRNELDGKAMYLQAAERTSDELGKSMFRSFAKEEEQHVHILQVQYAQVDKSGGWIDLQASQEAPRNPDLILFPQAEREVKEIVPKGMSDLEALELAMEFEQRAVRMYTQAADDAGDPVAESFYRELAKWENTHYEILDNSHDYLATKGEWYFQEVEMPMYEG